ncbi:flavocytochrome c [Ferrimonas lipolytica]|uniref:Fumarate reductase n=1 Tax=Ferrimonas lipolytica TaxID=2724191 RepID=A0A6H1UEV4_9GAMM|nr:flavocytochrome c [Ferrimonas lipolytica]QIZ77574.1 flavocytochrome c [Ferrimonas lipolytica]
MKPFRYSLVVGGILAALAVNANAVDNLAEFHAEELGCEACHVDNNQPIDDNLSVENSQCASCHGSLAEVAEETQRHHVNAHDSHLPGEPSCTTCHMGHEQSVTYCDSCHSFEFELPFGGKWQRDEPTIAELALEQQQRQQVLAGAPALSTDVVVIGSGGAGFSAAVAAFDAGAKVVLVEKEPVIGGNAKLAAGGMNAAESASQDALGIEDKVSIMVEDTMKGGYGKNDPALVDILANNSAGSVAWLTAMGADLKDVGRMGGASVNRSHRPTGGAGVGAHVVQVLYDNAVTRDIDMRLNTRAVEILKHADGSVRGLLVKGAHTGYYWIEAKAAILATGGFAKNNERVAHHDPKLKGFAATNHPGATGDGLDVAANAGASMTDLEYVQAHPTYSPLGGVMITEAVRGNGAILVNRDGNRFVNEITTRDVAAAAILKQKGGSAFLVFDDSVRKSLKKIEGYIALGIVSESQQLSEIAAELDIDAAQLAATVKRYNSLVEGGKDLDFARPNLPRALNQGAYYALEVTPAVHHTMGGVTIDNRAEVQNEQGQTIKGLYAAGEATGGVHGANRLGGNAISDIVTFGRLAGEQAAKYIK